MTARFRSLTRLALPTTTSRYTAAVLQPNCFRLSHPLPRLASNMSQRLATLDTSQYHNLPKSTTTLFEAKAKKGVSFEAVAKELGRDEVAVAALFYGQTTASEQDVKKLSEYFGIDHAALSAQLSGFPDRGKSVEMPPREPLIYRLYEVVQNYGYAYKAVMNEKFGDGIMSAIAFSTHVDKETDKDGVVWVNIKMRGKWLPFTPF